MSKVKKIVVLGSIGSGKSSLLKKLTGLPFSREEIPTMGLRIYTLKVGEPTISKLVFWELTSVGKLDSQPVDYLKGAHAAIYIFDLSRPSTYLDLLKEKEMLEGMLPNTPTLFVANKADLVAENKVKRLTEQFEDLAPIAFSAKLSESIDELLNPLKSALA